MKQIMTDFNEYASILEAEVVTIHTLVGYFKKQDMDYDENGNIFIGFNKDTKGLPILVAHTDNVLHGTRTPVWSLNGRRLMGKTAGIGFDDKAGIIGIIELWKHFKKQQFRIIFTAQEEVGGVGAHAMDPQRIKDAPWMLELDRRDKKDFIQTSGGTRLCSDEFAKKFIDMGFVKATGTFTDVNVFKEYAPKINMANISIGYYNAHSDNEYLDVIDFDNIINKVAQFIAAKYTFEDDKPNTAPVWDFNRRGNYGNYGNYTSSWKNCWCCGRDTLNHPDADGSVFCSDACRQEYKEVIQNDLDEDER